MSLLLHGLLLWPAPLPRAAGAPTPIAASLRGPVARAAQPAAPAPSPLARTDEAPAPALKKRWAHKEGGGAVPPAAAPGMPDRTAAAEAGPLDADGLRRYVVALAAGARRYRHYPALALERGWSGTAEVRIDVAESGRPRLSLARSSGHEVLDRQAVDMLARAAAATPAPASLRGRAFSVSVPVAFDAQEAR
ncbi:MAG: TonB family protein [Pseudomonadota bacterium]